MAYTMPRVRSCAPLAGQQFYPEQASILDLAGFRRTASVAGARGRLVKSGGNIYEADELLKPVEQRVPVRLVGNNSAATITHALDPAVAERMAKRLKARGINYVRLHHMEAYLMQWGAMYDMPSMVTGTRNYDPRRWAELDNFLYVLKQHGIYYSFSPASKNLALNTRGLDRWNETFNATGTITVTVTNGVITSATRSGANATPYPDPPSIIVNDIANSNGNGAVLRCTINETTGIIDPTLIVENGGSGYLAGGSGTNATIATFYGGTGRLKPRLRIDPAIRQHWKDMLITDFLNHVSPHTGIPYWQEPALCMVECMNEAHLQILLGAYGTAFIRPSWVNWLVARYGTIANLNAAWGGATFAGFWDANLTLILGAFAPADGTKPNVARWSDSQKFIADNDVSLYSWMCNEIRATGYPGMVVCRDMVGEPVFSRLYAETGCDMQSIHLYPALADDFAAGSKYSTAAAAAANAPAHYAYGTNPFNLGLAVITENVPWMLGEYGFAWPGIYRGEMGLLAAGYCSTHNSSGVTLHAETYNSFVFGPSNRTGLRSLRPNQHEHDPLSNGSTWLMAIVLHRGDIATLPITKTVVLNHRALNSMPDAAAMQAATLTYSFTQAGSPASYQTVMPSARQVVRWDTVNPNDLTIGNAWRTDINKSTELQLNDHGFNSGNAAQFEVSDWVFGRGNTTVWGNYEYPTSAIRYVKRVNNKPAEVFADRQAGLMGISTPRTQALVSSGKFAQGVASHVRKGNVIAVANTNKNVVAEQGYAYVANFKGNRFWENLSVDFIEDGTLLGVTSADLRPIAETDRMVVVASSNYYNTGQSHLPCEKIISSITLAGGTGYPDISEWAISQSSAAQASVIVTSVGGVPTSWRIVSQSGNFTTTALTASRVNGGAGTGLAFTFTLADAPESAEAKMETPFGGAQEGWPILQKRFVVSFSLIGIDMRKNWVLYELDFTGKRVSQLPVVKRIRSGIKVRIDSSRTAQPAVFFELVQE